MVVPSLDSPKCPYDTMTLTLVLPEHNTNGHICPMSLELENDYTTALTTHACVVIV